MMPGSRAEVIAIDIVSLRTYRRLSLTKGVILHILSSVHHPTTPEPNARRDSRIYFFFGVLSTSTMFRPVQVVRSATTYLAGRDHV